MNYSDQIKQRIIQHGESIRNALQLMDVINKKLLLVFDNAEFKGVLSIGDIQKAIISNLPLDTSINNIIRKDFLFARINDSKPDVLELMKRHRIECMPLVNKNGELVDVYLWDDVFQVGQLQKRIEKSLPVVIMAGGKGSRLKPLTNILPKPLIPIGEKSIIENIMDNFCEAGCNHFYITLNYRAEMIRHYFSILLNEKYRIEYIQEEMPLGTAGSLGLLKGKLDSTFFLSNCDILVEQEISEILDYHKSFKNEVTIVVALKHYSIPYGTLESTDGGRITRLTEKPDLTFKINTGFYIMEPNIIEDIPPNVFFNVTELIDKLIKEGRRVGVFPVSENSWKDIGEWNEYYKHIK